MASLLKSVALLSLLLPPTLAQEDDLGLSSGFVNLSLSNFDVQLIRDAQVLASLRPKHDAFDFLPRDLLDVRARNGQYHWGDVTYRYRQEGVTLWADGDSASRRAAIEEGTSDNEVLASSNLGNTLPDSPLDIIREWIDVDGDLGLRFRVQNIGNVSVEIGSLGFPAEFNSIFTNRHAIDMQALCSLSDPYIGLDAG
jgi:hypothetical protein